MTQKLFGWEMDKNVEDFSKCSMNMREEGHLWPVGATLADVIDYLIARVKMAEEKIQRMDRNEELRRAFDDD